MRGRDSGGGKINDLAKSNDRKVKSREVMVKEKLTLHQIEREVVQSPAQNRSTDFVVEALKSGIGVIATAALPSDNSNDLEDDPNDNRDGRRPPDDGVTKEIDLGVVATPEVDTTAKDGPRLGARVPGVGIRKASICPPHHCMNLGKLAEETGLVVVDPLSIGAQMRALIALNIPNTVRDRATTSASYLLLFRRPVRQLHLMRKENATGHDMNKPELGFDGAKTLLSGTAFRLLLHNLNSEEIVGITFKSLVTISRYLILPISFRDRGSDIVGVKAAVGIDMVQSKNSPIGDVTGLREEVPGVGTVDGLAIRAQWLSLILEEPQIVLILVRIQGNLLLLATGGVHQRVGVKVATLGINVTNADLAAHHNICGNAGHSLAVERRLELGAHETVSLARVDQAEEVDGKHGHVEGKGNNDQGEDASHEVLGP